MGKTCPSSTICPSSSICQLIKSPDQRENDKYPKLSPDDTEICNLIDNEFKIAIIKKLNEVKGNIEKQINEFWSYFTKEIETIKKNQSEILEMKDTMEAIKQNTDSLNARVDTTEERHVEMLQTEEERELRLKRNEEILQEISELGNTT